MLNTVSKQSMVTTQIAQRCLSVVEFNFDLSFAETDLFNQVHLACTRHSLQVKLKIAFVVDAHTIFERCPGLLAQARQHFLRAHDAIFHAALDFSPDMWFLEVLMTHFSRRSRLISSPDGRLRGVHVAGEVFVDKRLLLAREDVRHIRFALNLTTWAWLFQGRLHTRQ